MGYLYRDTCFPTTETARQSACAGASASWGDGATAYTLECTSSDFSIPSMSLCRRANGGTCADYIQPYPNFPSCDFSGDSTLAIDWMHAALWLFCILFGIKHLIRLFSGSDEK
jgi:hypothetical protein